MIQRGSCRIRAARRSQTGARRKAQADNNILALYKNCQARIELLPDAVSVKASEARPKGKLKTLQLVGRLLGIEWLGHGEHQRAKR